MCSEPARFMKRLLISQTVSETFETCIVFHCFFSDNSIHIKKAFMRLSSPIFTNLFPIYLSKMKTATKTLGKRVCERKRSFEILGFFRYSRGSDKVPSLSTRSFLAVLCPAELAPLQTECTLLIKSDFHSVTRSAKFTILNITRDPFLSSFTAFLIW